jgi:hypothetical protein
MRERVRDI